MSDGDSKSAPADADPPQSAESTEKPADSEVKAATTNETPPQDQKPAESQEKPAESQEKPTENQSGDTPTAPKANADQEKAAPRGCALDFTIRVYVSSVSIDRSLKVEQERILQVLDAKKVNHETVDVANNRTRLRRMRQMCENMEALPPQIFKGNKYLGDYKAFSEAVDDEILDKFLGI